MPTYVSLTFTGLLDIEDVSLGQDTDVGLQLTCPDLNFEHRPLHKSG